MAAERRTPQWIHQNRQIWAMGKEIGLEEEELRHVVEAVTHQRHLSALDVLSQRAVIRKLQTLKGPATARRRRQKKRLDGTKSSNQPSAAQIRVIRSLSEQLGWGKPALRAWLKRWHQADREEWLTPGRATKAVQALVEMVQRKQTAAAGNAANLQEGA